MELIARPDVVMLDLPATSREGVLRTMHSVLAKQPGVKDRDALLRDIMERVLVASICIAADVALPHARTTAVDRIVLGVARIAAPGVGFDGEHPNVRLMFMIGTPRNEVEEYLRLVASLSRLLRKPGARAALLAAPTESEFRALLATGAAT
jgi:mannitol/fructose-specific phosphotransferase system IIA component (Ntr-type)